MRPAVFLDRDGVIVENRDDYIKSWDEVRFLPDIFNAVRELGMSKYAIIVVTNQSVIGRGIITLEKALNINNKIISALEEKGGRIDKVYLCPHHPNEGCECRKPKPGLILQAAREMRLDLSRSYMIGDALSDMESAMAVDVRGILVLTGIERNPRVSLTSNSYLVVDNLNMAINYILKKSIVRK